MGHVRHPRKDVGRKRAYPWEVSRIHSGLPFLSWYLLLGHFLEGCFLFQGNPEENKRNFILRLTQHNRGWVAYGCALFELMLFVVV